MSQENVVEIVRCAIDAVNQRDIAAYLACCTGDVELRTPLLEVAGSYRGADGIRRFFADVEDTGPDFQVEPERIEAVNADQVIAFLQVHASARTSGVPMSAPTTNVYDLADGKISRIRIFLDRNEALEAVGLSE